MWKHWEREVTTKLLANYHGTKKHLEHLPALDIAELKLSYPTAAGW